MKENIVVLSPHLDDGVFSTSEYCLRKSNEGAVIRFLTLFSSLASNVLSNDSQKYMQRSGFNNLQLFDKARRKEDRCAMKTLGFGYTHVGLVDGGFRAYRDRLLYPSHKELFSGQVSTEDRSVLAKVGREIKRATKTATKVLVPLGVGNHVDHLITRSAGLRVVSKEKIVFYVEQPYGMYVRNWKFHTFLSMRKIVRISTSMSKQKQKAIACYKSQHSIVKSFRNFMPEGYALP